MLYINSWNTSKVKLRGSKERISIRSLHESRRGTVVPTGRPVLKRNIGISGIILRKFYNSSKYCFLITPPPPDHDLVFDA